MGPVSWLYSGTNDAENSLIASFCRPEGAAFPTLNRTGKREKDRFPKRTIPDRLAPQGFNSALFSQQHHSATGYRKDRGQATMGCHRLKSARGNLCQCYPSRAICRTNTTLIPSPTRNGKKRGSPPLPGADDLELSVISVYIRIFPFVNGCTLDS